MISLNEIAIPYLFGTESSSLDLLEAIFTEQEEASQQMATTLSGLVKRSFLHQTALLMAEIRLCLSGLKTPSPGKEVLHVRAQAALARLSELNLKAREEKKEVEQRRIDRNAGFSLLEGLLDSSPTVEIPPIDDSALCRRLEGIIAGTQLASHLPTQRRERRPVLREMISALPPLEEVLDKVKCLGPWLLSYAPLGCAVGASITTGSLLVLTNVGLRWVIKKISVSTASSMAALVAYAVFDETKLRRQAALSHGEKTFIYVLPKHDRNAASHMPHCHDTVREFAKGKKLVVKRIDSPEQLTEIVKTERNISHLWIRLHGNPQRIQFDRDGPLHDASFAEEWPMDHFSPEAHIILESCSTGAPEPFLNFAEELHDRVGKTASVTAPAVAVCSEDAVIKGGEVHFIRDGKDITLHLPVQKTRD